MRRRMKALVLAAAIASVAGVAGGAEITDQLRDCQTRQEQLRAETRQVADQLDAVIAQYHKNGLDGGAEVKTLRQIRAVLGTLSDDDMRQVIAYLDQARQQQGDAAIHTAGEAHATETAIIARLQALLRAGQRQQALAELAARFAQLAERQNANLGNIVETVRKVGIHVESHSIDRKDIRDALKVQQDQQDLLKTDVTAALGDLSTFADAPDPSDAKRVQQAIELSKTNKLSDAVGGAATSLGVGALGLAATDEKTTRDTLLAISRALAEPLDRLGRLKKAAQEIDQETAEQKRLADATAAAAHRTGEAKDLRKSDPAGVRTGQADLVDKTDQTRKDLAQLAPAAASDLQNATDDMQKARASLNGDHQDPAARAQQSALDHLAEARKAVQQQLDREQSPQQAPKDTLADLQNLKQQTHELKAKQDSLKDQAAAAHTAEARKAEADPQDALRQKAQDLQQQAADHAPEAAKAMADAAHQMDKATQSLQDARHDPAATARAQQSAADDLGKAEQQLDQRIAQATDESKQEEQARAARDKLADAIEKQQQVGQQTAAATNKTDAPRAQESKQAGQSEKQLAGDTEKLKAQVPDGAQSAAASLAEAQKKMDAAASKLDEPNPAGAQPAEKDAQADLYQAKRDLDAAIDKMARDLGHPPDQAKDLAELSKQLDQVQQELAKAQGQLAQSAQAPADGKTSAQQQMKAVVQKVGEMAAKSPAAAPEAAQQAIEQAQEHLGDAAAQAEAHDPAAGQSAAQAQQALAQAQASVAMAQTGMAQAGPPAPGQGQSRPQAQAGEPSAGNSSPGSADENNPASGGGNRTDINGGVADAGPRKDVNSPGKFVGLPPRDCQALEQSQAGKYPQAYGPEVEQYLRNLSNDQDEPQDENVK